MGLSLWTLNDIKLKIRKLTRHTVQQLSDVDLLQYINRYYQLQFPLEMRPKELYTWFSFDLVTSTDEYDLDTIIDTTTSEIFSNGFMTLDSPVTIDDYRIDLYLDPVTFYNEFPEFGSYNDSVPIAVLMYNKKLLFRCPPDDTYTVKFKALKRPTALAVGTDYPMMEEWGNIISYGTAIEILQDVADSERINELMPFYDMHKTQVMSKVQEQNYNMRSTPKF